MLVNAFSTDYLQLLQLAFESLIQCSFPVHIVIFLFQHSLKRNQAKN